MERSPGIPTIRTFVPLKLGCRDLGLGVWDLQRMTTLSSFMESCIISENKNRHYLVGCYGEFLSGAARHIESCLIVQHDCLQSNAILADIGSLLLFR